MKKKKIFSVLTSLFSVLLACAFFTGCNNEGSKKFKVDFDSVGGSTVASVEVLKGELLTEPTEPTKKGYTFGGWFIGNEEYDFAKPVTSDLKLVAKWTVNTYNVTLNTNGATSCDELTSYTYGTAEILPTPVKDGYTFGGWFVTNDLSGEAVTTISATEIGDKTFYAKWTGITYNVTLNTNGATSCDELTSYTHGTAEILPTPVKDGYTFGGWFVTDDLSGEAVTTISATEIGDKTFYAKWTVNTYNVTLNTNGATSCDELTSYTYGTAEILPTPVKTDSQFVGWYVSSDFAGDAITEISATDTGDKTFYALWYNNVITANSSASTVWGNGTATYSYDATTGASLSIGSPNVVGMLKVGFEGLAINDASLEFTATVPEEGTDDWSWNYVVFRGDASLDNFTAFAFRRGGGHMMLLSRVNDVWYTYADTAAGDIIAGIPTTKNCELGTGLAITGNTIALRIVSSTTTVKVYSGDTLVYQSALTLPLPAAVGIFYYSSANANSSLALSNIKCYEMEGRREIITSSSEASTAWGNGTATYSYDATTGASLSIGSPNIVGMIKTCLNETTANTTVLSFTATVPEEGIDDWSWNYVVFRGDASLDNFTAFAFRRGGGHMMLLSRVNGVWYTYADSAAGEIIVDIPTTKNCELGTGLTITGNTIDITIESTRTSVKVYANGTLVYQSALTLDLDATLGIFYYSAASGSQNLALSNIKCYAHN